MWVKKEFPLIQGYESLGDSVEAKRFVDFKLSQLLDTGDPVWQFRSKLKSREEVCSFVIVEFDYPFHYGVPTDKHTLNWFDGNCCHRITEDYWQTASETLMTLAINQRKGKKGYGDCEDTSALFTTLFLEKKWHAYMCLGYLLQDGQILGGHGFPIFEDEKGKWRLYESTLSIAPEYPDGYPIIVPRAGDWTVNGLTYRALIEFSRKEYYEREEVENLISKFLKLGIVGNKAARKKFEAISRAWGQKAKPLQKVSLLSKLRWR